MSNTGFSYQFFSITFSLDKENSPAAPGRGGGGGNSGEDSLKTKKIIHVIPTSPMHTIIQFCALLTGQLEEGSEPGTDNWGRLPSLTQTGTKSSVDEPGQGGGSPVVVPEVMIEEVEEPNFPPPEKSARLSMTEGSLFTYPTAAMSVDETEIATAISMGQATNVEVEALLNFDSPDVVEAVFLYCLYWSFAAPMHLKDQVTVDEAIKALSGLGTIDEGDGMPYVSPGK